MAASLTQTTVLGSLAGGNQLLSLIDGDLAQLYTGLNTLNNFSNYYADTGSASAYAITVPTTQALSIAAGLPFAVKAITANTGASTIQITAAGTSFTKNIVNSDGSALTSGQIPSGGIFCLMYDGTNFQIFNNRPNFAPITASLGTDITLGSTGIFFDAVSIAQGTIGTWNVTANATVTDTGIAARFLAKLHDGTTVIAAGVSDTAVANGAITITLSGKIASPAGNLRIAVRDTSATTGLIKFNLSGTSQDTTITAIRLF